MAVATPCVDNKCAIFTIIVSELLPVSVSIAPALVILRPTIPINTATDKEITTHIEATLLDNLSFSSSSIAINLNNTCGIPKYPSPHANIDAILRRL